MNLGNKIRELRKRKGITQEQLAGTFNISSQAVSKWEMGTGYPDMSLIPVIAGYFEVSLDVLFDYDVSQIKVKVEDILDEGGRYFWCDFDKAEEIYLNGIAAYPGAYKLKTKLLTLYECHMRNYDRLDLKDRAIPYAEKLLTEVTEPLMVADVKDSLASIYKMCDRYDEAKSVIESMPIIWSSEICERRRSAAFILKGEDRLAGTHDWKPDVYQDLFACCDLEGRGYFEIGDYENALRSYRESVAVIESFLKDGRVEPGSYMIEGTQSNHCHAVVGIAACLYKLGRLEECDRELEKAYSIPVNYYGEEEISDDLEECLWAYRESYHLHGLDDYKPCI